MNVWKASCQIIPLFLHRFWKMPCVYFAVAAQATSSLSAALWETVIKLNRGFKADARRLEAPWRFCTGAFLLPRRLSLHSFSNSGWGSSALLRGPATSRSSPRVCRSCAMPPCGMTAALRLQGLWHDHHNLGVQGGLWDGAEGRRRGAASAHLIPWQCCQSWRSTNEWSGESRGTSGGWDAEVVR